MPQRRFPPPWSVEETKDNASSSNDVREHNQLVGLVANLVGVILLFRYGMPFRIRTGGSSVYVSSSVDPKEVRAERRAEVLGWIGLILIVLGTAAQIGAVFL